MQKQFNKKGFAHIFLIFGIVVLITIGGWWMWRSGSINRTKQETTVPTSPTINSPDIEDWKTYTDNELGFQIKIPEDFYSRVEEKDGERIVKFSNNELFDEKETALTIKVEKLSESNFTPTTDEEIINILDKIGFRELKINWSNFINGNFLGDPPWNHYQIAFPAMDPEKDSLLVTTIIHRIDELPVPEGGTEGKLAETTKQILSTFKFFDTNKVSIRGKTNSPSGDYTAHIRTTASTNADEIITEFVITDNNSGQEKVLLTKKGVDSDYWISPSAHNWSPREEYIYLHNQLPDGGNLYIFRTDGGSFDGKEHLNAFELGYDDKLSIKNIKWADNTTLEIETTGILAQQNPELYPDYIFDIEAQSVYEK